VVGILYMCVLVTVAMVLATVNCCSAVYDVHELVCRCWPTRAYTMMLQEGHYYTDTDNELLREPALPQGAYTA